MRHRVRFWYPLHSIIIQWNATTDPCYTCDRKWRNHLLSIRRAHPPDMKKGFFETSLSIVEIHCQEIECPPNKHCSILNVGHWGELSQSHRKDQLVPLHSVSWPVWSIFRQKTQPKETWPWHNIREGRKEGVGSVPSHSWRSTNWVMKHCVAEPIGSFVEIEMHCHEYSPFAADKHWGHHHNRHVQILSTAPTNKHVQEG